MSADDTPPPPPGEPGAPEASGPEGGEPRAWRPGDRAITPPVAGEDGSLRCGYCDAVLAEDQTYCLECGSPTPVAPGLRRGRAAVALAVGLAVLGAGAGVLAFFVARSDDDSSAVTTTALVIPPTADVGRPDIATGPLPPDTTFEPTTPTDAFPTDTGGTVTEAFPTDTTATGDVTAPDPGETFPTVTGTEATPTDVPTTEETTAEDPTTEVPPTTAVVDDWPSGTTAWTAILSSVRSEFDARRAADDLIAEGQEAGVLVSDDHPGLRPGYYVVFSGVLDDRAAAVARAQQLAADWPGAYARRIEG